MKIKKTNKYFFLFYLFLFFIINVLQGGFTQLIDDEAYYWMWSKHLAWGYFDHPPMVALWIKISSIFFKGELGVRFFSTIMFGFTVFLIWKLIDFKEKWNHVHEFFLMVTSVILFNFYGFITVPDTPLLFFVALFLLAYKHFLKSENLKTIFLLGFAMAGMLYSKYHGILVICFVVLSNVKLLKNKNFWKGSLLGFILFTPHLFWQYQNGFPSILYQFERSKKLYRIAFSINHLLFQLLIVGLAFPVIYLAFFRSFKQKGLFTKALRFIVVGFIVFFFISTFKTSTQPQWTAVILIPLMVLGYPIILSKIKLKRWFIILASLNLVGLILLRIFLADENLSPFKWETHENKIWAKTLKQNTKGLPIVFHNSFQYAAKYQFYTGIQTYSYNSLYYRLNQYDLPGYEEKMQGKTVYEVSNYKHGKLLSKKHNKLFYGQEIKNYTTFQHLKCIIKKPVLNLKGKLNYQLTFNLENPYNVPVPISTIKFYGIFQTKKHQITKTIKFSKLKILNLKNPDSLSPLADYKVRINFLIPKHLDPLTTTFRIGIGFYDFPAGFEGNAIKIIF